MVSWPPLGSRVSVRYRLPAGSHPPLTDVIGHLVEIEPRVRVETKSGELVEISPVDVVAVRPLTDAPVRASQVRALEHAAALAWPGIEQEWLDGWLLRSGHGVTHRANSAVPLDVSAHPRSIPAIVDWFGARGLTPWLAAPDRLLRLPPNIPVVRENRILVLDLPGPPGAAHATLAAAPDDTWLTLYRRPIPVDVLTAVLNGEVTFGSIADAAVGRAAVTTAPDGTRWVGLSAVEVSEDRRRRGYGWALCAALLDWGADRGATRGYVQVLTDNVGAITLYESMGFRGHHRSRYVDARRV
jgi:N-acetylglutamate synthase